MSRIMLATLVTAALATGPAAVAAPITISVEVTVTGGVATYKAHEGEIEEDGTITVEAGDVATITFEPAEGQTWSFQTPWVSILSTSGTAVSLISGGASAVVIEDDNAMSEEEEYTYCLQTTDGPLDPRIINTSN